MTSPAALALVLAAHLAGLVAAAEPPASCLAETFPTNKLRCLSAAAKAAGDPTLCLAAEDTGVRWICVARVAEAAGEADDCLALPKAETVGPEGLGRELCRVHLATAWERPDLCEGVATTNLEDACYLQMVEAGADAALCGRIEHPTLKSACGGGE